MNDNTKSVGKSYKTNNLHIYVVYPRAPSTKEKGKWDVYEEVYIKNSLKYKLLEEATIVLDCGNMEVRKDRTGQGKDFYHYLSYLAQHHYEPANIKDYIDRVYSTQKKLQEMELEENNQETVSEDQASDVLEEGTEDSE